jgi:hypothetical protein
MGFEKDQGTCTGRGFSGVDADGLLKNLHDFVTAHADWSIILDRSALPSQVTCTDANGTTEIITAAAHGYKNGEMIRFQDLGNGIPSGLSSSIDYFVGVESASTFKVYTSRQLLHAGTEVNIGALAANFGVTRMEPYILISDDGTPSDANDLKNMMKWGYHTEEAAFVRCQWVGSYDSANEEIVFIYDGLKLNTLDAAAFVYDFRGNDNGLFYVQTQISGTWRGCGSEEFTPLNNYLEDPTSISGTAQTALSNGSNVVVQVTDAAEANLFTSGEWYYVYDFRYDAVIPRIAVAYGECNGVGVADGLNADEIRFATLNNDFNTGAKISPYPLTKISISQGCTNGSASEDDFRDGGYPNQLPFYGYSVGTTGFYCIHDQLGDIQGGYSISREERLIITAAPDDKGNYTVQRPLVCEVYRPSITGTNTTQMNRPYGVCDNVYCSDDDGLAIMTTGRTIDSKEHISVGVESVMFTVGGSSAIEVLMINEV